jgi:hypothetical protein
MSSRERWIVYPLLFLALGTAIKPKLVPAERVTCRTLDVVDDELRTRIRMTAATASDKGEIRIANRQGESVVVLRSDAATRAGSIETFNDNGKLQTAMMSSATGGEVATYDNVKQNTVVIGHRDGRFGLIETNLDSRTVQFVPISKLAVLSKLVP